MDILITPRVQYHPPRDQLENILLRRFRCLNPPPPRSLTLRNIIQLPLPQRVDRRSIEIVENIVIKFIDLVLEGVMELVDFFGESPVLVLVILEGSTFRNGSLHLGDHPVQAVYGFPLF